MVGCTLDYDWHRSVVASLVTLFGGVVILLPIKLVWHVLEGRRRRDRSAYTVTRLEVTLCRLQSAAECILVGSNTVNKIIVSSTRHPDRVITPRT